MTDLATAVTVIDACGRVNVPVLLLSDPGMGKSSLVRGLAAAEGVPCETVLGSIREPADLAGLPVIADTGVTLAPPPAWAKRLHDAEAGYLFLDELTTCPPTMQAAMLAVALDRVVGDLKLPPAVRVVAGANPPDRAADGWEIAPPLATGDGTRAVEPHDLAVVTAHVSQAAAVRALLADLPGVLVRTANQFQGMERPAAVLLHPLAGYRDVSEFGTDLGRACVMHSHHRAHLCVVPTPPGPTCWTPTRTPPQPPAPTDDC